MHVFASVHLVLFKYLLKKDSRNIVIVLLHFALLS